MSRLDPSSFEGAYVDTPPPGHHLIQPLATGKPLPAPVIKIPTLEVNGRRLFCAYQILDPQYTNQDAQYLIKAVLLDHFCDHYYDALADGIDFFDLQSQSRFSAPM